MKPFRRAGSSIVALAESLRPKSKSKRPPIPFEAAVVTTMDSDNGASPYRSNSADSIQRPEYIQHATGTRVMTRELAATSTDSLPQLRTPPRAITEPRTSSHHSAPQFVSFQRLPATPLKQVTNRSRSEIPFGQPPPLSPATPPPEYSLHDMNFSVCKKQSSEPSITESKGISNQAEDFWLSRNSGSTKNSRSETTACLVDTFVSTDASRTPTISGSRLSSGTRRVVPAKPYRSNSGATRLGLEDQGYTLDLDPETCHAMESIGFTKLSRKTGYGNYLTSKPQQAVSRLKMTTSNSHLVETHSEESSRIGQDERLSAPARIHFSYPAGHCMQPSNPTLRFAVEAIDRPAGSELPDSYPQRWFSRRDSHRRPSLRINRSHGQRQSSSDSDDSGQSDPASLTTAATNSTSVSSASDRASPVLEKVETKPENPSLGKSGEKKSSGSGLSG